MRRRGGASPRDVERIGGCVDETAELLADHRVRVPGVPVESRAEARWRQTEGELVTLRSQIRPHLTHARIPLADARILRGDRAGRRYYTRRLHEHRARIFVREREPLCRIEIQIESARLIQVERVGEVDPRREAIVQRRAAPIQVRPHASRGNVVPSERRHVRNGVHKGRRRSALAARRDVRRIAVGAPIGNRRSTPDARHLLRGAREPTVIHGRADEIRPRQILEESNASANNGAWAAHRALERRDLSRRPIRPREPDARAHIQAIRNPVIAQAEQRVERGVERGLRQELIPIEPHAVRDLQIVRAPIGIAERHAPNQLSDVALAWRQLPCEGRRRVCLEVRERVVGERAERVDREQLVGSLMAQLARQLEPVFVVGAEPRELILGLERRRRQHGVHRGIAADRERLHPVAAVGERRVHADPSGREIEIRCAVVLRCAHTR